MMALDTDKNGELSAKEIENAARALAKLDKNEDGKLDREELRPQRGEGGRGGAGGHDDGGCHDGSRHDSSSSSSFVTAFQI